MPSKRAKEVESLCKAYSLSFKDCGNGHLQISGHGVLVNYWPDSAKRTIHCPQTGRRERNCEPFDAIKICLHDAKSGTRPMRKKDIPKNRPAFSLKTVKTNPAGLRDFYSGSRSPWELDGDFEFCSEADALLHGSYQMAQRAILKRAELAELEEAVL